MEYFQERDPSRTQWAVLDPKLKMALIFRWHLGMSSHWANAGNAGRVVDYQISCGPVVTVAMNILHGAAVLIRTRIAGVQGLRLPPGVPPINPTGVGPN
jgi:hypothetical protein